VKTFVTGKKMFVINAKTKETAGKTVMIAGKTAETDVIDIPLLL
jgi:hypothetical protein